MTGTALVGPLRRYVCGDHRNILLTASLPRDTTDIRARACPAHWFACDCREAEIAEYTAELRGELASWTRAARTVLAGHRTWDWDDDGDERGDWRGDGPRACRCHGCQVVRAANASVSRLGGDYATGIIGPGDAS
jgi:hypothetical protein